MKTQKKSSGNKLFQFQLHYQLVPLGTLHFPIKQHSCFQSLKIDFNLPVRILHKLIDMKIFLSLSHNSCQTISVIHKTYYSLTGAALFCWSHKSSNLALAVYSTLFLCQILPSESFTKSFTLAVAENLV